MEKKTIWQPGVKVAVTTSQWTLIPGDCKMTLLFRGRDHSNGEGERPSKVSATPSP